MVEPSEPSENSRRFWWCEEERDPPKRSLTEERRKTEKEKRHVERKICPGGTITLRKNLENSGV